MSVEPRYAPEVEALLQALRARDGEAGVVGDGPAGPGPAAGTGSGRVRRRRNDGGVVWDDDALDAFMAAPQESYRRVRVFCDVLAGDPGDRFTTSAACASAGLTATQLRAALGKFTTWISASIEEREWPFGWAYGEDVDPQNPGEFHYEMTDEQATWRAARGRVPEPPR